MSWEGGGGSPNLTPPKWGDREIPLPLYRGVAKKARSTLPKFSVPPPPIVNGRSLIDIHSITVEKKILYFLAALNAMLKL